MLPSLFAWPTLRHRMLGHKIARFHPCRAMSVSNSSGRQPTLARSAGEQTYPAKGPSSSTIRIILSSSITKS
jgi:hypothetical protein